MSRTSDRTNALPDVVLGQLSEFVAARLGLHFPPDRWPDLERAARGASKECGLEDTVQYVQQLPGSKEGGGEVEVLARHLTVGETYFFRDQRTFEIVEKHILPTVSGHAPNLWSAGCSTGEEPYSIAILLSRTIPAANFKLLATDLNPRSLQKATEGIYGEWSFRAVPDWLRKAYFWEAGEGKWAITPTLKKMVTFERLNLAQEIWPKRTQSMDIIFCRNVLMYFHPEITKKVVAHLHRSLQTGGWLIVSPAETSSTLFASFAPVVFHGITFYRKTTVVPELQVETAVDADTIPALEIPAWFGTPSDETLHEPAVSSEAASVPNPDSRRTVQMMQKARSCANQGELREALRWCERAIATGEADSAAHYLHAAILQEQGSFDAAAHSLRRAIYLDPKLAIAHFALGTLEVRRGKTKESAKHLENALRVLGAYEPGDILPEADGLTAGQLRELILRRKDG